MWEAQTWTALEPTEGYRAILLQENTTEVLARFRHFSERNLNAVCGLGASRVTSPHTPSSWRPGPEPTVEKRLLDAKGNPRFHLQFYVLSRSGEYAGVSLYAKGGKETARFAVCTEKGPETLDCDALFGEGPAD